MGKLTAEDQATLDRLLAQRDAPDEDAEVWIEENGRVYKLRGSSASRALEKLLGGDAPAGPAKKAAKKAATKAAPPQDDDDQDDDDQDDDDDDQGVTQDPPSNARAGNRAHRLLGFGS